MPFIQLPFSQKEFGYGTTAQPSLWNSRTHTYKTGQSVLAKDNWNGSENGHIALENVIYEVDVYSSILVRHANQLRASYLTATKEQDAAFLLDILLDTFDLPQQSPHPSRAERITSGSMKEFT